MSQKTKSPKDYTIQILHERPECGCDVEFVATYYVREDRDLQFIEETFRKAFNSAHPSWLIKKVLVTPK